MIGKDELRPETPIEWYVNSTLSNYDIEDVMML